MRTKYDEQQLEYIRSKWGKVPISRIAKEMGLKYNAVRDLAVKRMHLTPCRSAVWTEERKRLLIEIYPVYTCSQALKIMRQHMPDLQMRAMINHARVLGLTKAYDISVSHEQAILTRQHRQHIDHLRKQMGMDAIYYGNSGKTPPYKKRFMFVSYLQSRYGYIREPNNCKIIYYNQQTNRRPHLEVRARDLGIKVTNKTS